MLRTRYNTLVYVVIWQRDPKMLCLHKKLQPMPMYCLYIRHKLDACNRYVMHSLEYVSTNVCGRMRNSANMLVYAE